MASELADRQGIDGVHAETLELGADSKSSEEFTLWPAALRAPLDGGELGFGPALRLASPSLLALAPVVHWRILSERPHRPSTSTTSQVVAVGGNPVSNLALTTANLLPWRATVVGIWNSGLVMIRSTVADDRSELNRSSVT